jgi:hypothetical protein
MHDESQRRRSEGRYRIAGRFGPTGRRHLVPRNARARRSDGQYDETVDAHELYATQTARSGEGLYTLVVWALSPRIAGHPRFLAENPRYHEGAACWGIVLSSPDSKLRSALSMRWLGRPLQLVPGPQPEPPLLLRNQSWPTCLEAEFGVHALAEELRAQGLGIVVY